MTRRIDDDIVVIEEEPEDRCHACGNVAETRPYGPGGSRICFDCGMKDEAGTERRMNALLFGQRRLN